MFDYIKRNKRIKKSIDIIKEKFEEYKLRGKHSRLSVKEQWLYENDVVYSYDKIFDQFFKDEAYIGIYEAIGSSYQRYYINLVYRIFSANLYLFHFTNYIDNFISKLPSFLMYSNE